MNTYLLTLGWWNFFGSILMLGFMNESFGRKVLNEWTKIFKAEYKLDHWSRLWLLWTIGLNIFFGLVNVMSVSWGHEGLKFFLVVSDVVAYSLFVVLTIWATAAGKMGSGVYSVFAIFAAWITWGIMCLF
ncbi:MAG: hypothetical protein K0S32_4418 [Bacteroidetes bacterium]|nr:hypothetical protein [Bacteroidota bacterium]